MQNNSVPATEKAGKNKRLLIIFTCAFLSLVLLFGAVFGAIVFIKDSRAVLKLGSVRMEEGVVRVFASYYKSLHLTALRRTGYTDARDVKSFWSSVREEDGKTQEEIYLSSLKNYLAGIAGGCNLMRSAGGITAEDKAFIKQKCEAFISYYGSEEAFNREAAQYGFNYKDFCRAMELSYTSNLAFQTMYGYEGANLRSSSAEALAQCEEFLSTYSHVKLLFLCDDEITELTEDGDYVTRALTDEEKAERENMASELREAMANAEAGLDGAVTETMFDIYLKKSDGDPERHNGGYYFRDTADQTAKFAVSYPSVVNKALSMKVGEYAEVECSVGVCFIYKYAPVSLAYQDDDDPFFSDFYSDAATYLYTEAIKILAEEANFKDSYYEIDVTVVPENKNLFITGWQ